MDQLPKGQSGEVGGNYHAPGVYEIKTPDGTKRIITSPLGDGETQASALVQSGWTRVGELPTREELQKMQQSQVIAEAPAPKTEKIT